TCRPVLRPRADGRERSVRAPAHDRIPGRGGGLPRRVGPAPEQSARRAGVVAPCTGPRSALRPPPCRARLPAAVRSGSGATRLTAADRRATRAVGEPPRAAGRGRLPPRALG